MSSEVAALKNELDQLLREVEQEASAIDPSSMNEEPSEDSIAAELEAIANEPTTQPILIKNKGEPAMSNSTQDMNRSGSLNLDLSGEVTIDLKLNFGAQTVYISCDNENLLVQLGDGTSFRLPFSGAKAA